ncbi:MAG: glycosyltransferase family 4 protein [Acidobacteriaceae bacterium]
MNPAQAVLSSLPKRPRILFAADAYLPWSGGSRVYYHNLYSRLALRYGYDVSILTSHTPGDREFDRQPDAARLQIVRYGRALDDWKYKRLPAVAAQLCRSGLALARISPVAFHCGDLIPQAFNAMMLHKLTGRPYLVYVHGDEISQTNQRRYQPRVRDAIYRNAAALIAANPYALAQLRDLLGSTDRCHLLTPGVDFRYFYAGSPTASLCERFGSARRPVLLTAARLVKKKGHASLLRALVRVVEEFPTLLYLVAGDGPERQRLEASVQALALQNHVVFLGDVPHEALGEYYRFADMFVMPNRIDQGGDVESFGMVFIEANACGKPVIGGRSGGTSAAVAEGTTGLLCQPNDDRNITATMLQLLRDPELMRRMGAAGAERARKDFCWDTRAGALHAIIQRMMLENGSVSLSGARAFPSPGEHP